MQWGRFYLHRCHERESDRDSDLYGASQHVDAYGSEERVGIRDCDERPKRHQLREHLHGHLPNGEYRYVDGRPSRRVHLCRLERRLLGDRTMHSDDEH